MLSFLFFPSFPSVVHFRCPSAAPSTGLKGERFSDEIRSQRSVRKISSETACRHDLSTSTGRLYFPLQAGFGKCLTCGMGKLIPQDGKKSQRSFGGSAKFATFVAGRVVHQCKSRRYVEIRTVANPLPRFLEIRTNFLFLADYMILPKIVFIYVNGGK